MSAPVITAIRRNQEFSPSHEDDDWRILELTGDELARSGYPVQHIDEEDVGTVEIATPVVLNMCQGPAANTLLRDLERQGRAIFNRPSSCLSSLRINQLTLLERAGVPLPRSLFVDTDGAAAVPAEARSWRRIWVKRGEVHATEPADVVQLESPEEIEASIASFRERGIRRVVLQEHLEGPVVKFYAVRGGSFFRWYPFKGTPAGAVDEQRLQERAEASAAALGLEVYGGECVLVADGSAPVIDVNDWPSFARFRDEAAGAIARHVLRKAKDEGKL